MAMPPWTWRTRVEYALAIVLVTLGRMVFRGWRGDEWETYVFHRLQRRALARWIAQARRFIAAQAPKELGPGTTWEDEQRRQAALLKLWMEIMGLDRR
jgi:hypothetical protein